MKKLLLIFLISVAGLGSDKAIKKYENNDLFSMITEKNIWKSIIAFTKDYKTLVIISRTSKGFNNLSQPLLNLFALNLDGNYSFLDFLEEKNQIDNDLRKDQIYGDVKLIKSLYQTYAYSFLNSIYCYKIEQEMKKDFLDVKSKKFYQNLNFWIKSFNEYIDKNKQDRVKYIKPFLNEMEKLLACPRVSDNVEDFKEHFLAFYGLVELYFINANMSKKLLEKARWFQNEIDGDEIANDKGIRIRAIALDLIIAGWPAYDHVTNNRSMEDLQDIFRLYRENGDSTCPNLYDKCCEELLKRLAGYVDKDRLEKFKKFMNSIKNDVLEPCKKKV